MRSDPCTSNLVPDNIQSLENVALKRRLYNGQDIGGLYHSGLAWGLMELSHVRKLQRVATL